MNEFFYKMFHWGIEDVPTFLGMYIPMTAACIIAQFIFNKIKNRGMPNNDVKIFLKGYFDSLPTSRTSLENAEYNNMNRYVDMLGKTYYFSFCYPIEFESRIESYMKKFYDECFHFFPNVAIRYSCACYPNNSYKKGDAISVSGYTITFAQDMPEVMANES